MKDEIGVVMCVALLFANVLGAMASAADNNADKMETVNALEAPQLDAVPSVGRIAVTEVAAPADAPLGFTMGTGGISDDEAGVPGTRGTGVEPNSGNYYEFTNDWAHFKTCRSAQNDWPLECTDPTDTFLNTDPRVYAWSELNEVKEEVRFKWNFFRPDSTLYSTCIGNWIQDPKDQGQDHWDWVRGWCWYALAGTNMADNAGVWRVDMYVEEAHEGWWQYEAFRNFRVIDNTAPSSPPGTPSDEGDWSADSDLLFSWSPAYDSNGIGAYQLRIALSPGGTAVFDSEVGTAASYTYDQGENGKTYFATVRARNQADDWTSWSGCSNGIAVDTVPPSSLLLLIQGGAAYSNSRSVQLSLYAEDPGGSGVNQMKVRNEEAAGSWVPYATSYTLQLSGGEGQKVVKFAAKDKAGNIANEVSSTIFLDSVPPTVTVVINNGDQSTNSRDITLSINAVDPDPSSTVSSMSLSSDGTSWMPFEAFVTSKNYQLPAGDGNKTVFVRVRDMAINVGQASDDIVLDSSGPIPTVMIADGAEYTNTHIVRLDITTSEPAIEAMFRNEGEPWPSSWEPYSNVKTWQLSDGDGEKIVFVRTKDAAGNSGEGSARILLDSTPPQIDLFMIDAGAVYSNSTSVILTTVATDPGSGLSTMSFKELGLWSPEEVYVAERNWTLSPGDGLKAVTVKITDLANNVATAIATITLDTAAPEVTLTIASGAQYVNSTIVALNIDVSDPSPGSGAGMMSFSTNHASWTVWQHFKGDITWILSPEEGLKSLWARVEDSAGNIGEGFDQTILDTIAPTVALHIDGDTNYTNSLEVTLTISAADEGAGVARQALRNEGSAYGQWEPYTSPRLWQLTPFDGLRRVFAKLQDAAGNSAETSATITLDSTAPEDVFLSINGGAPAVSTRNVSLSISAIDEISGLSEIRLRNEAGTWSSWIPFTTTSEWNLSETEGEQQIDLEVCDVARNVAEASAKTILDTRPPWPVSVIINDDAQFTADRIVTLQISAEDPFGSGVEAVAFSHEGTKWTSLEPYSTSKVFQLTASNGEQFVFLRAVDRAGNIGQANDSIILDTQSPVIINFTIDDNTPYTNSLSIALDIQALDPNPGSGLAFIALRNEALSWSPQEAFTSTRTWSLPAGDASKSVSVRVYDGAGNFEESSATILLDQTPPTDLSIVIEYGLTSTTYAEVNLTLAGSDPTPGSGLSTMSFKNGNGAWSSWEPFQATKLWSLEGTAGIKVVYYRTMDNAGNIAAEVFDSIALVAPEDGDGSQSTTALTPILAADRDHINESEIVIFTAFLKQGEGYMDHVEAWSFDFGDGFESSWITSRTIPHQYASPGLFVAKLRLRDDQGRVTDAAILPIYVLALPQGSTTESQRVGPLEWAIIAILIALTIILLLAVLRNSRKKGGVSSEPDKDDLSEQQDDPSTSEGQEQPQADEDYEATESKLRELLTLL